MSGNTVGISNYTNRPNETGAITYPGTVAEWFDTTDFTAPTLGAFGNAAKNAVRDPYRTNFDTSLFKDFSGIKWWSPEGATLEFRAETFNTFNHTQFSAITPPIVLRPVRPAHRSVRPRVIQLGLKFLF